MNIVFLGSADFGIPALDRIIDAGHSIGAVVTTPDRPKGRGRHETPSPIALHAIEKGLSPVLKPSDLSSPDLAASLREVNADLFVVVAFRILPESVFSIPRLGTVNIHASLLPRYRGPAPIQRAIENGEVRTGVTIFRIDRGIDTGALLAQESLAIGPHEATPELYNRLAILGADAIVMALAGLSAGTLPSVAQDPLTACGAPKLRKEEGHLDWSSPAVLLANRVRAFKPFPGSFAFVKGIRLNIEEALPVAGGMGEPGIVCDIDDHGFSVQCGEGRLRIVAVKPEGKKAMSAAEYLRGAVIEKGTKLL